MSHPQLQSWWTAYSELYQLFSRKSKKIAPVITPRLLPDWRLIELNEMYEQLSPRRASCREKPSDIKSDATKPFFSGEEGLCQKHSVLSAAGYVPAISSECTKSPSPSLAGLAVTVDWAVLLAPVHSDFAPSQSFPQ